MPGGPHRNQRPARWSAVVGRWWLAFAGVSIDLRQCGRQAPFSRGFLGFLTQHKKHYRTLEAGYAYVGQAFQPDAGIVALFLLRCPNWSGMHPCRTLARFASEGFGAILPCWRVGLVSDVANSARAALYLARQRALFPGNRNRAFFLEEVKR